MGARLDRKMSAQDLLSTPNGRAGLKATIHLASEAVLRQLCLNRGLETYQKSRSDLEQNIVTLIGALDNAGVGSPTASSPNNFSETEPLDNLSISPLQDEEGVVYDRSQDQAASWQEKMLLQAREDKEHIEQLQAELERYQTKAVNDEREARATNSLGGTIGQAQNRLVELWGIAETEASDRLAFFTDLESMIQPNAQVLHRYDQEISRLSEMLPLIDCVSRRDFVLHRLRESMKLQHPNQQQASFQPESLQRTEFATELKRLNHQLSHALSAFEKRYARRFLWKGEYILQHVQSDLNQQLQASKIHAAHSSLDKMAASQGVQANQPYTSRADRPTEPNRGLHAVISPRVLSSRAQQAMERARTERELATVSLGATARPSARPSTASAVNRSVAPTVSQSRGRSASRGRSMARTIREDSLSRSAMRASPSESRRGAWR